MKSIASWIQTLFENPYKVLMGGLVITLVYMSIDGSLWNWWSLRRNMDEMSRKTQAHQVETQELQRKIDQAMTKEYIIRRATEQHELLRDDELVFIFSDDEQKESQ